MILKDGKNLFRVDPVYVVEIIDRDVEMNGGDWIWQLGNCLVYPMKDPATASSLRIMNEFVINKNK